MSEPDVGRPARGVQGASRGDATRYGSPLMSGGALSPLLLLTSPLGDDRLPVQAGTLHATRLRATERLSAPFEIELEAVSTERAIDPDELLYQPLTVTVRRKDGIDRPFNGLVRRVVSIGVDQRSRWRYRLDLVPRLWFLCQSVDCRIFQQQTAVEILQTLFSEHGVDPVEFRIFGSKPKRPYTTQFNETDLTFVQRILQESGYYYYFEHGPDKHTLIIADGNQAFRPQPGPDHRVIALGDNVDIFDDWREARSTAYGHVKLEDRDPEKPQRPVSGQEQTRFSTAGASLRDVYRWPAMTIDNRVAADRARFRVESCEAAASLGSGHGFDPNLCAGFRFSLIDDPIKGGTADYIVHGTTHRASDETWLAGTAQPAFDCDFTCFPQTVTWRDDLSIPRPAMAGVYSGIVLGNQGEEIHADYLARIKVQPLFDHRKDTTADRSIFIRILHAWSGDRWGWQHLPRVGTEVGISFMNGDPDNPVVVGCFYHEENMPVFPVPDDQTRQGFRSRSTLKGGSSEFNELSFEDKRGDEEIFIHAQKDFNVRVNNDTTIINRDGSILIKSPTMITLNVGEGSSTIVMTPENISIKSPTLNIVSGVSTIEWGVTTLTTAEYTITSVDVTWTSVDFKLNAPIIEFEAEAFFAPFPIPDNV